MDNNLKILIVRLSAIGDVVHSLPVVYALRRKFPDAHISWIVEDKAADILIGNPLLDKVYVLPKKKWKKKLLSFKTIKEIKSLISEIRSQKFDIAIDLQELFKSGFITFLSGAKRRIAHAKTREFADIFINEKLAAYDIFDPNKMIIERYLDSAEYLGAPVDEVKFSLPPLKNETIEYVNDLLKNTDKNKPIIIFSPATMWESKHWIEEYWSELLSRLYVFSNIVFTGTHNDKALIERITKNSSSQNYISLVDKTSLFELIELFNRSDIVVAPDTGPAHIANASNKPVIVTIFGATSNKRTCPYGDKHVSLSANLECQPCSKKKCPRKDYNMLCMKKITPDIVFDVISGKIQKQI